MNLENKHLVGIIIAVILVVALIGFSGNFNQGPRVSATGSSELTENPDELEVYFSLEAKGDSSDEVAEDLGDTEDEVLIELLRIGLEREDIRIQGISVQPNYVWNSESRTQTQDGWVARENIVVKTEDLSLLGNIVDAGVLEGSNLNWVNFALSLEKQNELKVEALKLAGEDAKRKAEATASGVGKSLGSLVSIKSQDFYYYPYRAYEAGFDEGSVAKVANLNPEEITVTAQVVVEYKLASF
jgi:uncharacterized protein YggE